MPLDVPCPHCQTKLSVTEEFFGRVVRCSVCAKTFQIPEQASRQEADTPEEPWEESDPWELPLSEAASGGPEGEVDAETGPQPSLSRLGRRRASPLTRWLGVTAIILLVCGIGAGISFPFAVCLTVLLATGSVLLLAVGFFWMAGTAFRDSLGKGLLCAFVPFYVIVYARRNWTAVRPATCTVAAGLTVLLLMPGLIGIVAYATGTLFRSSPWWEEGPAEQVARRPESTDSSSERKAEAVAVPIARDEDTEAVPEFEPAEPTAGETVLSTSTEPVKPPRDPWDTVTPVPRPKNRRPDPETRVADNPFAEPGETTAGDGEQSLPYTRLISGGTTYEFINLIVGPADELQERLRWCPGVRRATCGMRWGVAVETLEGAEPLRSDVLVAEALRYLKERSQAGDFGVPLAGNRSTGRSVRDLGRAPRDQMLATAAKQDIDLVLCFSYDLGARTFEGNRHSRLHPYVFDTASGEPKWSTGPFNPIELSHIGQDTTKAIQERFALTELPGSDPESARDRVAQIVESVALNRAGGEEFLPDLAEIRYYETLDLIDREMAVKAYEHLLGYSAGQEMVELPRDDRIRLIEEAWFNRRGGSR